MRAILPAHWNPSEAAAMHALEPERYPPPIYIGDEVADAALTASAWAQKVATAAQTFATPKPKDDKPKQEDKPKGEGLLDRAIATWGSLPTAAKWGIGIGAGGLVLAGLYKLGKAR